ncbi:MAG TPA: hypothetical protein VFB72_15090 [Verrucomicrobiae bacterium]|nr:hypothetical protein [Verrucomicrobiae bacterium]
MKQSSAQRDNKSSPSDLDLDLPVDTGFRSHLEPVSADAMLRHNRWLVEKFNSLPDAEERRLRTKCNVEFVL